jgi:hypothetical protein
MKKYLFLLVPIIFTACTSKKLIESKSATVLFKTPNMKFYDKGFITNYGKYIHLQIFNVGQVVLDLEIYKDEVCQGTLQCISAKEFNTKYLSKSYSSDFLYNLFSQKKVYHKDKQNKIFIKVK